MTSLFVSPDMCFRLFLLRFSVDVDLSRILFFTRNGIVFRCSTWTERTNQSFLRRVGTCVVIVIVIVIVFVVVVVVDDDDDDDDDVASVACEIRESERDRDKFMAIRIREG